jgi:hypothetical protein
MKKRRDFLKATGVALGGAAISGILSVEATAEPQKPEALGRARKGNVAIRCAPGVKIESIHEAVKQSLGILGCPACGLLGIDLHIGGGDPSPLKVNAPGINGASFNEM